MQIEEELNPKPKEPEPEPQITGPKPETLTVEGQRKLFEELERQFVTSVGHSSSGGLGKL